MCVTRSPSLVDLPCEKWCCSGRLFLRPTYIPGLVGSLEGPRVQNRGVLGHDVGVGLPGLAASP